MTSDTSYSNLTLIIDDLNNNKKSITTMWLHRERLKAIFKQHDIKLEFFLKYFGHKIVDYNLGVIDKGNAVGNCPIVHVMIEYFESKEISIEEIYLLCSELKNTLLLYYMKNFSHLEDVVYYELVDLLDANFSGVLHEYFFDKCQKFHNKFKNNTQVQEYVQETCSTIKTESISMSSEREKDIRFTQHDKISAVEFLDTLDNTIIDKVEFMTEHSDNFITTLYDFEESKNGQEAFALITHIKESLAEIFDLISSLIIFNVTARAFENLSAFLSTISKEMLEDQEKKALLATMLLAVANDFEKWMQVIFIDQSTLDVHYFDASFSSNILEIENIFLVVDEDDDDDLEFF